MSQASGDGNPRRVKSIEDARQFIAEIGAERIKIGWFDVDGIMRGKYMSRDKFLSALEGGFGFCDVVVGWDSNDQLYDNATFTGWHTAYPDAEARIVPETCRLIPFEPRTPLFIAELAGRAEAVCPRGLLKRVLARAAGLGYDVSAACEFEFFVFKETPHSVREKHYRNLTPITPGFFGYSVLRSTVHAELYHDIMALAQAMDFPIEGLHTETGAGVLEAAIAVDGGLAAADKAALFKTFIKANLQRQGLMATFMAKWSPDWPGQSGHIHLSLKDRASGKGVFHDPNVPHNISTTMRHFIGGQQALLPEFLSMVACTVNSYTRLIPGFWAPTQSAWGIENRTTALRAIPGSEKSQRVEFRIAAADINPYIALSAAIGAGLWGIENRIEPTEPIRGNAYEQQLPEIYQLPRTLFEAAGRLRASKPATELFGATFTEHYAASREWEERESRKAITDWQLSRYFEIG